MDNRMILSSALASAIALGLVGATQAAPAAQEKCFGIAKAGQNDCATDSHSCAGLAKKDKAADEWVYAAKGTCAKAGGKLKA